MYSLPSPCSTGSLGAGTAVVGSPRLGVGGDTTPPPSPPASMRGGGVPVVGELMVASGSGGRREGRGRTSPMFATGTMGGAG